MLLGFLWWLLHWVLGSGGCRHCAVAVAVAVAVVGWEAVGDGVQSRCGICAQCVRDEVC